MITYELINDDDDDDDDDDTVNRAIVVMYNRCICSNMIQLTAAILAQSQ